MEVVPSAARGQHPHPTTRTPASQSAKHLRSPLLAAAAAAGFEIVPVRADVSLASQGPFDALLHKIRTPGVCSGEWGGWAGGGWCWLQVPTTPFSSCPEWRAELDAYAADHPDMLVVDPPPRVAALASRATMLTPLQGAGVDLVPPPGVGGPPVRVGAPAQVVLQAGATAEEAAAALKASGLAPPLLAKPLNAGAGGGGHRMALLTDAAAVASLASGTGLSGWAPPAVLQPYVPHVAPLFKVFVMGPLTVVARRPSLRVPPPPGDVTEVVGGAASIARVSAYVSEADAAEGGTQAAGSADGRGDPAAPTAPDPPRWALEALASHMRSALGLTLFNFDLIAVAPPAPGESLVGGCPAGASYLVIDINYFPGFEKLPDYESLMAEFLGWLFSAEGADAVAAATAAAAPTSLAGAKRPALGQTLSRSVSQRPARESESREDGAESREAA